ncbi:MAG: polysaccharide deacetylase family protein [Clostridiaceae bacterium]|nr:polysaccharide deacetylase family protein [Clostridiaceae bacterium]
MAIRFRYYPGARTKALTMSYDDGREYDRRLVALFDRYGIRGTFHLNSGFFDRPGYVTAAEVPTLYRNHEISCHTEDHPFLENMPETEALREILSDRSALETRAGYPVRGMSYPFGTYDDRVIRVMRAAGMEYARTVRATHAFRLPDDWMAWHPTCHHADGLDELLDQFTNPRHGNMTLFYVWGHSYEFNDRDNWDLIEGFCAKVAALEDTWLATNIEIVDYVNALRGLRVSADGRVVMNPSCLDVWIEADGVPVRVASGETLRL